MASGREMTSSVLDSSDVIHYYSCTPCSEDGKNVQAVTFCVNCETYFCASCVGLHNKLLKSHSLLDQEEMKAKDRPQTQLKTRTELLKGECFDHPGNVIQMYCGEHDLVCCTVCIAVDHRACKGVDFIPKVAKGILKGQERKETRTSLQAVYMELLQLKTEKSNELSDLSNAQDSILKEIGRFKEQIVEKVNELERKSTAKVQAEYKEISSQIHSELKSLEELLRKTRDQIETLDQITDNEAELFVGIKYARMGKTRGENLVQKLKHVDHRTISFKLDSKVESVVKDIENFGTLSDISTKRPYTATLIRECNCKTGSDNQECLVFDSCILDDGHVLITDYNNQKLKRLDSMYKLTDYCKIDRPFGVCKTGPDTVAVSSWDGCKVCIVTTGKPMAVNHSFSVDRHCRGIVYNKGELFVATGLLQDLNNSIKVYNLSGMLLRTLPCKFCSIMHLSIDHKGSNLYVADSGKGLIKLNRQGETATQISVPHTRFVHGVTHTDGYFFVCCKDSNSVIQFDEDGNLIKEILTATDGIKSPVSVTFASSPKRLIITFWPSDTIKVFNLS